MAGSGCLRAFPRLVEPFPPQFLTTNVSDSKLNPFVASSQSFPGSFLASFHSPEAVAWHNRPRGRERGLTPMRVAFGEYQLDTETRILQREGRRIPVQSKAFDLLAYLIERRERVVPSDELLDALWPGLHVTPAALSTAVQKARQAVGDDGEHQTVLHTEHGKGFRFIAEVTNLSEPETAQPAPASFRTRIAAVAGIAALLLGVALAWFLNRQAPEAERGRALAVLPFVNMSTDADQEYFADGISEELLNTLAHFEGLHVVGRTSSFSFRDSDADLKTIGERLGVDVILEGSVRTAGDRVRITAQLVNAEDGFHRWSETYDRKLTDIFAIQTEIATAIADALRVSLSSEERERLATPPTENLEAYQAYLLGRQRLAEEMTEAYVEAIDYFQRAIALDADFALAYVGLAWTYIHQGEVSGLPLDEMLAKAQVATNKALELDDRLGQAHTALGEIKWLRNEFAAAEAAFQRGLELSPNSSRSHLEFGSFLADEPVARYEEALASIEKALELDPLSVNTIGWIGVVLNRMGRFDESMAWLEKALEIGPDFAWSYSDIGIHHWFVSGRLDEAVAWMTKAVALDPENNVNLYYLGELLLDLGDPDQAENWIARSIYASTYLYLYRGDEAAAVRATRKAYAIWPLAGNALPLLRDHEVRAGRYAEARALYVEHFPELLYERDPKIDRRNYRAAVDLALILSKTGEQERADLLLDRSLQQIQGMPRVGRHGWGIADVQIYALRGEKQKALSALRRAIDEGWREKWWYQLKLKPDLEPLHDEPEYQAMVAEIEADMATQLARVREMERSGELEPIPEVSATSH